MIAVIPEEAPIAHARPVRSGGEIIVDYLVREKVPTATTPVARPVPALAVSDPAFPATLEGHTLAPVSGGNSVQVLLNGDEIFPTQLAAIGCDLIVMASHGRSGVSALVLGSETMKVLTHTKIPTLVCR